MTLTTDNLNSIISSLAGAIRYLDLSSDRKVVAELECATLKTYRVGDNIRIDIIFTHKSRWPKEVPQSEE